MASQHRRKLPKTKLFVTTFFGYQKAVRYDFMPSSSYIAEKY